MIRSTAARASTLSIISRRPRNSTIGFSLRLSSRWLTEHSPTVINVCLLATGPVTFLHFYGDLFGNDFNWKKLPPHALAGREGRANEKLHKGIYLVTLASCGISLRSITDAKASAVSEYIWAQEVTVQMMCRRLSMCGDYGNPEREQKSIRDQKRCGNRLNQTLILDQSLVDWQLMSSAETSQSPSYDLSSRALLNYSLKIMFREILIFMFRDFYNNDATCRFSFSLRHNMFMRRRKLLRETFLSINLNWVTRPEGGRKGMRERSAVNHKYLPEKWKSFSFNSSIPC